MKCPHCGYEWDPRVEDPKTCPHCKRTLHKTDRQLQREKEKELVKVNIGEIMPSEQGFFQCRYCSQPAIAKMEIDGRQEYVCRDHAMAKLSERKQPNQVEAAQLRLKA